MKKHEKHAAELRPIMVLKLGTDTLAIDGNVLDERAFRSIAMQVVTLRKKGVWAIVVSSAGIAAGRQLLGKIGIGFDNLSKKILAGVGAQPLLACWQNAFARHGIPIVQFWLTPSNWKNHGERAGIKHLIFEALARGLVPVVNENDVVSDQEIRLMEKGWGENDLLAARVACLVKARFVAFLSSVGGVFEKKPEKGNGARKYRELNAWDIPHALRRSNGCSKHGKGGINTKITAAAKCHRRGMKVCIAGLSVGKTVLLHIAQGERVGTLFGARTVLCEE